MPASHLDPWRPPAHRRLPRPPRRPNGIRGRMRRVLRSRVLRAVAAVLVACLLWTGWSIGRALSAPGTDSAASRVAEWARDHHLGWAVTDLEKIQYWWDPPKAGGTPVGGIPSVGGIPAAGEGQRTPRAQARPHLPAPAPVRVLAGAALPNEGQWQTVDLVGGQPAVRVSYVRPDNVHTSYLAGLIWVDPKLALARLHPGTEDPGGTWPEPSVIPPEWRASALVGINGGFRLGEASRGGYYAHGRLVHPLRAGAASFVIGVDGTATVGQWERDMTMGPGIVAVRQNLDLLVDGGVTNPSCASVGGQWGATLGNASYVARSGIGVTATGALVYVGGPAMSVCSLGQLMQAAGVVRGMELDINPAWIRGAYYTHDGGGVVAHKLVGDVDPPADRLFSVSQRDFIAFYARP